MQRFALYSLASLLLWLLTHPGIPFPAPIPHPEAGINAHNEQGGDEIGDPPH